MMDVLHYLTKTMLNVYKMMRKYSIYQECVYKGNFITWPGIEEIKFKRLLGAPLPTVLGHPDQE